VDTKKRESSLYIVIDNYIVKGIIDIMKYGHNRGNHFYILL